MMKTGLGFGLGSFLLALLILDFLAASRGLGEWIEKENLQRRKFQDTC